MSDLHLTVKRRIGFALLAAAFAAIYFTYCISTVNSLVLSLAQQAHSTFAKLRHQHRAGLRIRPGCLSVQDADPTHQDHAGLHKKEENGR